MRFAIVNNQRALPSPDARGSCPACGSPVIAKCGDKRVHHWAHLGERVCDVWWEPRTPWHCAWQDKFPKPWQEVIRYAPSGEKHIADVHTEHGLTIEIQYSRLRPEERAAREGFYRNMVWVVSGARLRRDLPRFLEGMRSFSRGPRKGVHLALFPEDIFPRDWLNCAVPVFFDFANAEGLTEATLPVVWKLWCLLPGRVRGMAVVLRVSRENFVRGAHGRSQLLSTRAILQDVEQMLEAEERAKLAQRARQHVAKSRPIWWPARNPFPTF